MRLGPLACLLVAALAATALARAASAEPAPIVDDRPAAAGAIDAGAALVAEGTALGAENKYEQALARFLTAAGRFPSATHDCLVALAYARIGRLTPARLWLDTAGRRGDPVPVWCATMLPADLTAQLATRGFVAVDVAVAPADAEVWIGDDAHFRGARVVWLPPGEVAVRASRDGHAAIDRRDVVAAGSSIELALAVAAAPRPGPGPRSPPAPARSPVPWIIAGAGGAALIAGAVFHVQAAGTRGDADAVPRASAAFAELDARFVRQRTTALALYGAGAVGVAVGVWLIRRQPDRDEPRPRAGVTVAPDGAALTWGGAW